MSYNQKPLSYVDIYNPTNLANPTPSNINVNSNQYYTYFQPPPFISTIHKYQTVNGDKELQRKVTNYFLDKTRKWIKKDKLFSKKYLSNIKDDTDGFKIIHNILKLFVRRGETNWYDLKEQCDLVKEFIKYKLSK